MKRVNPYISCLIFSLPILCFLLAAISARAGVYYRYTDKNGTVHFTDRYEGIPAEYRNQVQTIRARSLAVPASPPIVEPSQRRGGDEQPRQPSPGSPEREAEEKAIREAEERKLQARLEKEKQIEALKKEINSRIDEQKKLRTNWMVYDRAIIYRLNQEIEGLQKQIQAIQEEIAK